MPKSYLASLGLAPNPSLIMLTFEDFGVHSYEEGLQESDILTFFDGFSNLFQVSEIEIAREAASGQARFWSFGRSSPGRSAALPRPADRAALQPHGQAGEDGRGLQIKRKSYLCGTKNHEKQRFSPKKQVFRLQKEGF